MTDQHTPYYDAFEIRPVPPPGPDAVAPEPYRGIYGMPAFVTIPTHDLSTSTQFWTAGLGFFELFTIPGTLVHLRRWAFQDVLLVAADPATLPASEPPALTYSYACILTELDGIAADCRALAPGAVGDPRDTPWNSREVEILTPENARIVVTAAKPYEPDSAAARSLAAIGITPSQEHP
ncbi:glycosyltransferase [Microbacterium sp. SGAir0570]|uniref:VOC family protein n=1 Tax=Microbacterium sp. SGAir0570 TaxID=2070348 RepID=UPI0010CD118E|nr:VOC family protein [Microbacterium sp. SGAir0570]QCR41394.1 glycosyltransferase [Microbacterium sp. SGAir0570]